MLYNQKNRNECGRVAQLGEHLLCKQGRQNTNSFVWCRLRLKTSRFPLLKNTEVIPNFFEEGAMTLLVAILLGALLGSHPALAVAAILYLETKMRQSESLLACVTLSPSTLRNGIQTAVGPAKTDCFSKPLNSAVRSAVRERVDVDQIKSLRCSGHSWHSIAGMMALSVGKVSEVGRTQHHKALCACPRSTQPRRLTLRCCSPNQNLLLVNNA